MPISATNYDGSTNYSVAEMGDLTKPNILDNADFSSGIINQKGQTTYTITQQGGKFNYFIDRWKVWVETGLTFTCTVGDNYITVKIAGTDKGAMQQSVNIKNGVKYCLTAKIDGAIKTMIFTGGDTKQDDYFKVSGTGKTGYISIFFGTVDRKIEWVKLEEGEIFTGLPTWNEAIELLKCQRKFQIHKLNTRFYASGAEYTQRTLLLPTALDSTPTVTVKSEGDRTNITSSSVTAEKNRLVWVIQPKATGYCSIFNMTVYIDGNDY